MAEMRKVNFKSLFYLLSGLIIGITIGSVSVSTLVSYRIDKYIEKIAYLHTIIEDKNAILDKLEESINKKNFILKDIEVNLIYDGDEIEKITLVKHIKAKYTHLIGKEVKYIDADLVETVIDKRIFKLNEKEYRLKVDKLVLADVLKIWVEVNVSPTINVNNVP